MTAHALIAGTIFRTPERKTAKNGNPYVVTTIRTREGDGSQFWRVTAFSESAQDELMLLADGDAVSAAGRLDVKPFEKDGVTRISFAIVADRIMALRQPAKKSTARVASGNPAPTRYTGSRQPAKPATGRRRVAEQPSDQSRQQRVRGVADPDLNDDCPF